MDISICDFATLQEDCTFFCFSMVVQVYFRRRFMQELRDFHSCGIVSVVCIFGSAIECNSTFYVHVFVF